jgi:hypothetical protein
MIAPQDVEPTPPVAVLIGLVSTEDGDRILETLTALADDRDHACEVILVDRRGGQVSAEIARRFPQVLLVSCSPDETLPAMRALALSRSRASIVAVTEDHCVPCKGWLGQIIDAFAADPGLTAVGGPVQNGVFDTGFDWATFLCEYSFFSPPVDEGRAVILPGMNVAYRRDALAAVPASALTDGFWETTVHQRLLDAGGRFRSRNRMVMYHCKRFSAGLFLRQRFVYSRYYAGLRFPGRQTAKRAAAAVASLALPPILLGRIIRSCLAKDLRGPLLQALPALLPIVCVWSVGESWGYIRGPGRALAEIE